MVKINRRTMMVTNVRSQVWKSNGYAGAMNEEISLGLLPAMTSL